MLFSPYIVACRPAPNKDAYVHVFQMNAELLKNNKAYACYVNLVNAKGSFGIITDRALPIVSYLFNYYHKYLSFCTIFYANVHTKWYTFKVEIFSISCITEEYIFLAGESVLLCPFEGEGGLTHVN